MKTAKLTCGWFRTYDRAGAAWIAWLDVNIMHGHEGGGSIRAGQPCARAVVDDFGTLVMVESWA